ncbi:interferon-induced very large GTPase 1 isoform X2 [Pleuronectes platessa]|uniref:interferon-induced very large GTPase 1 isoform X2 n=1 Tax=Pleuronectes platessa TaxID=8262 RepID=UPI00232A466D|nr:interferon-induced very large GTPase 1 isoform X2 [Pleuronectes platessa]XP_053271610.1 interferon-induced very large GTPase 1 isoform X2 [Pleuronectes platessa]
MDCLEEEEEFFATNDTFPEPYSGEKDPSTTQSNYVSPPEEETPLSSGTRTVSDPCSDPLRGSGIMEGSSTLDVQGRSGTGSPSIGTSANTQTQLQILLEDLGLKQHYTEKLTLSEILQIDLKAITDEPAKSHSDLPWYFLKKLMMVNVTARNLQSECESSKDGATETTEFDFSNLCDITDSDDMVNPLDVITALFLCSDGFVQQEMALKMSMCQFSVPLLLPGCDTDQCKLMLWAMRDIVKTYRPQSLVQSKGFIEERIVLSEIPMISFVRLGECSMSKSEILNKLLSNDCFVHHDMECADSQRRISNGLTEITWYLPSGKENIDIFSEPLAVANLRGDIASFETQFSFLCQTSAAVFVFFDNLDPECKLLTNLHHKTQMFLVGNQQSKSFSMDALKTVATKLGLSKDNIIIKTKHKNYADFVKGFRKKVNDVIENTKKNMCIEKMADIAHELGILVDEDCPECQTAKENAEAITSKIQNIPDYKATQLPLHGEIWKELTILEKEEFRLKNLGSEDIETYKAGLQKKKRKLRKEQSSKNMSDAMMCFISAISSPGIERRYFLKWMRMNLDNLSREKLSGLRKQYKEKCKDAENKEAIKDIDKELSNSSLGTEHFFREMGQIYEASVSLPEQDLSRKQLQHLPQICAGLLLDGFPLELVDGDASNIPLTWVKDVLSQLNELVSPKNKILVVTVLGVQSTGKSTLLNTMFGVQFAVSSGRCTRGAFILLVRINEDAKEVLNCDFMVIIDTEGLKSAELAQLDDSHEHDNELATLVVGLSDITIINIAMENSTQMKDILQIVVHAFLRMKEVGKKPKCQFVHQNVSDVSANENTLRERHLLLDQLNEMTEAAAKMEKKEKNKCFTDVMEYNPETGNWYIPGLWNGNPPMAPVNAGYSEAVYQFKKNITQILGNCESSANDILKFKEWMSSLWKAVKHENFIFSFRNSLVADAYMKLCTESNNWEWDFKESIYKWITNAETTISNLGTPASKSKIVDLKELILSLKSEVSTKLTKLEEELLEKLKNYFEQKDGHVHLVERYKEDFANNAKSLRRDMQNSVYSQLTAAAEIKQGQTELQKIKENHTKEIERAVCALIDECRKKNMQMGDEELNQEFGKMWKETVKKLSFSQQKPKNVFTSVSHYLRINLSPKGSHACELLSKRRLQDCGKTPFKYTAKGLVENLKKIISKVTPFQDPTIRLQNIADNIIDECIQYMKEKDKTEEDEADAHEADAKKTKDYSEAYIQEILRMIDERLQKKQDVTVGIDFEVFLKQHICGIAARHFQKMHEDFLKENDPHLCLNKNKEMFFDSFKDVFKQRDQSQKKAEEFTKQCLKPAVENFVYSKLGPDIIHEMRKQSQFIARVCSQYEILLDLLSKDSFREYARYIRSYEGYVKKWILDQTVKHLSKDSKMFELVDQHLDSSISSIKAAIHKATKKTSTDLKTFINNFCQELGDTLVISQDALGAFMILNKANQEQFAHWFTEFVNKMEKILKQKFKKRGIQSILKQLDVKPQNELFTQVIGCGKQCPFCGVACVCGGGNHSVHEASLHRPKGLNGCMGLQTEELVTDICSSSVVSDNLFRCDATKGEYHLFKNYRDIFPDWNIPPDGSYEASDYWKYVMATFNEEFAEEHSAKPADIPTTWKDITRLQAEQSLKGLFNIK